MSEIYLWLKWGHIVSSTVLFGMGAGIAFFFIRAHRRWYGRRPSQRRRRGFRVSEEVSWSHTASTCQSGNQ